ncbi:MAG: glycosyltransferase [Clostridiales bacterium]|nr:glycosyltransferase [Clostridiales bacterium]
MKNVIVVLPSLNPDERMPATVDGMLAAGFEEIVVVNDGSDEAHMAPFEKVASYPQVTVLHHEVNKGKGRGLKTAFGWILENRPDALGAVTVDGDGQHHPDDAMNCAREMVRLKDHVIIGARDFLQPHVPRRNRMGNRITSFVFKLLVGMNLSDTQTGLRAIPRERMVQFMETEGERFEYETNMLLDMKSKHIPFTEVKIQTIYEDKENYSTHFHPIRDSWKVYKPILKFAAGGLGSALIDILIFTVMNTWVFASMEDSLRILVSTVIARLVSSFVNYNFNRGAVFKSSDSMSATVVRYYILCAVQMTASWLLTTGLVSLLPAHLAESLLQSVFKLTVDLFLALISFNVQREWVFKNKKGA